MDLRHDATVPKYPEPLVSDVMWGSDAALGEAPKAAPTANIDAELASTSRRLDLNVVHATPLSCPPSVPLPSAMAIAMPAGLPQAPTAMPAGLPQAPTANTLLPPSLPVVPGGDVSEVCGLEEVDLPEEIDQPAVASGPEDASESTSPSKKTFEELRAEHIIDNKNRLKELGLYHSPPPKAPPKPRAKRARAANPNPTRAKRPQLSEFTGALP